MTAFLFYLFVKPISRLPFSALYVISDLAYFFGYKLGRYRVKVVNRNLRKSFPDKSEKEITQLRRQFYHHFADIIVESLKIFSITEEEAMKRFKVNNPEILDQYVEKGRSVLLVGGHYNNWEMLAVGISGYIQHEPVAIYHRLGNKFLDAQFLQSRSKFGLKMISRQEVRDYFATDDKLTCTIFGADQSPSIAKKVYWMDFLNQDTPVMFGVEKFAGEKNSPVIFGGITKVKRGHYEFDMEVLFDDPSQCEYGEITRAHTLRLEKQILQDPQYWLWTHKRWKRKRKPGETN